MPNCTSSLKKMPLYYFFLFNSIPLTNTNLVLPPPLPLLLSSCIKAALFQGASFRLRALQTGLYLSANTERTQYDYFWLRRRENIQRVQRVCTSQIPQHMGSSLAVRPLCCKSVIKFLCVLEIMKTILLSLSTSTPPFSCYLSSYSVFFFSSPLYSLWFYCRGH